MKKKNEIQTLYGLTDFEFEILQDRWKHADCICEVFEDTDCLKHYNTNQVCQIIDLLLQGQITLPLYLNTSLTMELLHEAVDGSTYFADAEYELSPQKFASHWRAGARVASVIEKITGRPVRFRK